LVFSNKSNSAQIDLTSGQTWGVTRSGIQHNFDEIYPIIGNVPLLNGTHTITGTYSFPDIGYDVTTWDGIFTPVTKNSLRDYMYNFDADGDGSFTDETWFPSTHSALTLGTNTNGLSILGQVLSLDLANTDSNGSLAFGDYNFIKSIDTESELKSLYNLEIGTDVQAYNSYLGNISGLTPTANSLIGWNSGATALENKSSITLSELNVGEINSTAIDGERRITLTPNTTFDATLKDPGTNRIIDLAGVPGYVDTSNVFHAFSSSDVSINDSTTSTSSVWSSSKTSSEIAAVSGASGLISIPPAYRDTTGAKGQYAFSANGLTRYDCVSTNTWFTSTLTDSLGLTPTPPTITGLTLATNGTTLTMAASEAISAGSGFSVADLECVGPVSGTVAVSSVTSGDGTDTWVMELASEILKESEEGAVVFNWAGTADGIEDGDGTDLAAITSMAVTNNSTQTGEVACSTDTVSTSNTATATSVNIFGTGVKAQSFQVPSSGLLSSISISTMYTSSCVLEVRYGTSTDLSTTYIASQQFNLSDGGDSPLEQKLVFTNKESISTGTTYYFACKIISESGASRWEYSGNEYANGSMWYGSDFDDFSSNLTAADFLFKIHLCD